ncbi:acyl-CoA thioesterase-1 [Arcticibacter pallidicorallinus]|uniref:Acyl-CoA thioesterase-1 n=1 Tax=Arcticibacter pallidicorallinus TaxID=1259464 RepID=A0A2T0U5B0_9SPHI|nr:arylesterase [Arcticibacter pallidicorallinus]PRY53113.1 acyl-CoA thioesterase-1 [Arcticibacter pallidicorallinus]
MNKLYSCLLILISLSGCTNSTMKENQETKDNLKNKETSGNQETKNILFFGNSLTAGYGLDDPSSESFPSLIQARIDSMGLKYNAINAGLSGETTAGGKGRIGWLLKNKVDIFVLELGANDGLRGVPVTETARNLQSIVDTVKQKYPDAKLMLLGMQVPPNMGGQYARDFNEIFPLIAKKNEMLLVPFLLKNVAGIPQLNLQDGIHPTAEGQKILAENVWEELKTIL